VCEIYPIRKSNKPPYIYWKILVIIGVGLLVSALLITPFATYTKFIPAYVEEKRLLLTNNSFRVPQKNPVDLMISFKQYITYLRLSLEGKECSGIIGSILEVTTNKTYPLPCGKVIELRTPGVEVFQLDLNIFPRSAGEVHFTYNYTVYEVTNPYSYLTYVGLFLSLGGASAGVLGVVLMIKKKILEKAEEKYLK